MVAAWRRDSSKMTSYVSGWGPRELHAAWNFPVARTQRPARETARDLVAVLAKGRIVKQTVSFIPRLF